MRVELRHIRAFIAVAEELHFRRAAERLNLAQPALTRTIQQLEDDLDVTLFSRNNRRVELTAAGKVFLEGSYKMMTDLDEAKLKAQKAEAGDIGHLKIGYTDFAISGKLPFILDQFRNLYPQIKVELIYGSTHEQLEDLKHGNLDFAFLTGPLREPGFIHLTMQRDRFIAVLSETHPLAAQEEITLGDLANEPFVVGFLNRWGHFRRHLDALCISAGFIPRIVQEAFNSEGVFGFIAANIGVTIHLESARNYTRKGVVMRSLKDVETRIPTEAAWMEERITPVKQKFIDFLIELGNDSQ